MTRILLVFVIFLFTACTPTVTQESKSARVEASPKLTLLYSQQHTWDHSTVVQKFEVWEGPALCLVVIDLPGDGGGTAVSVPVESCKVYR